MSQGTVIDGFGEMVYCLYPHVLYLRTHCVSSDEEYVRNHGSILGEYFGRNLLPVLGSLSAIAIDTNCQPNVVNSGLH